MQGIIRLGEDAKYSVGMTMAEEQEARRALANKLKSEEERISEQSLQEYLRMVVLQA